MKDIANKIPRWAKAIIVALLGLAVGLPVGITITPKTDGETKTVEVEVKVDTGGAVEFGTTDEPVDITNEAIEAAPQEDIKTVETVDGGKIEEFAGYGEWYPTDTYENFIKATINKCVSEGNPFGAQCVSLAQAYWTSYAGYGVDLCGTGAARGMWACKENNAKDSFVLIENAANVQPGDWIITDGGTWGHVAMAVGYYNNGYIAVYGENQGGVLCPGGGSQPNVINLSMRTFLGAFRPKDYIIPEPEPEPVPDAPDTSVLK
jgi:hypothetical protein